VAAPCFAGPPQLEFPLDCVLGETCFIDDYVDADPGEGQRDYSCGVKTRDGHRGTDFVLPRFDDMARGVDVLAAAPGRVDALRDGMADAAVTPDTRADIEGRECGNAVRVDHGDGWQTLYCHMRNGSITVDQGQVVKAGEPLGQVGLSGLSNVPHLHLTVLKDGNVTDPFRPKAGGCDIDPGNGMWRDAPDYDAAGLYTAGFATAVPDFDAVASGSARVQITTPDTPLVLYGFVHQARNGDRLGLSASGPEGEIFNETVVLKTPENRLYRAFGRKRPAGGWPEGAYRGYVTLSRDGRIIAVRHADIEVRR